MCGISGREKGDRVLPVHAVVEPDHEVVLRAEGEEFEDLDLLWPTRFGHSQADGYLVALLDAFDSREPSPLGPAVLKEVNYLRAVLSGRCLPAPPAARNGDPSCFGGQEGGEGRRIPVAQRSVCGLDSRPSLNNHPGRDASRGDDLPSQ